jgi:hypothetical protein
VSKKVSLLMAMAMVFVSFSITWSTDDLAESVAKGCEKELASYCTTVTPGNGRILACLYAYSDKLTGQCEYALYDTAVQLERLVATFSYVKNECDADLNKFCSAVDVGKGHLLECLDENSNKISARCAKALKDVSTK